MTRNVAEEMEVQRCVEFNNISNGNICRQNRATVVAMFKDEVICLSRLVNPHVTKYACGFIIQIRRNTSSVLRRAQ
jgi:hypothetical protein